MTPEPPVASALTLFRSVVITACFVPTLAQLYWQRAGISKVDAKRFWMAAFVLALANAGTIGLLNTGLQVIGVRKGNGVDGEYCKRTIACCCELRE
jgi:hypothetical protein